MSILIVKLGALGDLVMATSALRQIQSHHAPARCTLLTGETHIGLFRNWPELRVTGFPRHGVFASLQMLRFVRSGGFRRIYDLQSNDRTSILCALSGVKERVGNHPRFPYTHHPQMRYTGQCHIYDRMQEVLRAAGITVPPDPPGLPTGPGEQLKARQWLESRELAGKPIVLLHAGSSAQRPEKRWPGFAELAEALRAGGLQVIYIGAGPDAALNRSLATRGAIDATGSFSVLELAALASHARFAVTGDSGPMHVLAGAGLAVYALFGASDARRNHAVGQAHHVMTPALGERGSLAQIPVGQVLDKLRADGRLG